MNGGHVKFQKLVFSMKSDIELWFLPHCSYVSAHLMYIYKFTSLMLIEKQRNEHHYFETVVSKLQN